MVFCNKCNFIFSSFQIFKFPNLSQALRWGKQKLSHLESGSLDADLLLAHVLDQSRAFLMAHEEFSLSLMQSLKYHHLVHKRSKNWPLAYLIKRKEFYGLDFFVDRNVLIPRVDTEILVEGVVQHLSKYQISKVLLVDVGTGSGCIPVSILKNVSGLQAVATDISRSALGVAEKNAIKHGVGDRLKLVQMDLLSDFHVDDFEDKELFVTANLPYVPLDWERHESTKFEPDLALFAEDKGLFLYKKFVHNINELQPKLIFVEMFEFQLSQFQKYLKSYQLIKKRKMTGKAFLGVFEKL